MLIGIPISLTAYLVPATNSSDAAGIDLVSSGGTSHAEVQLKQNASGAISTVLDVDLASLGIAGNIITGTSLTVNGTLGGKPFVRMPSNCSPGPSSLTVTYANGKSETSSASPDFKITGCSSLPFDPQLSAAIVRDPHDSGTSVTTTITQNADEAATSSQKLTIPYPTLAANLASLSLQNTSTRGRVGQRGFAADTHAADGQGLLHRPDAIHAHVDDPLPTADGDHVDGHGQISTNSTVTFSGIPDVPQTKLVVALFGGKKALESSECAPPTGTLSGSFTGQNGKVVTDHVHVTVQGCPKQAGAPSASDGSLSGVAKGKPVLGFKLTSGSNAPGLKAFSIGLPHGLGFNKAGLRRGLSVRGVKAKAALKGGKLVVTLTRAVSSASVKLASPLLKAKKHLHGTVKLRIAVTDAGGTRTTLHLSIP